MTQGGRQVEDPHEKTTSAMHRRGLLEGGKTSSIMIEIAVIAVNARHGGSKVCRRWVLQVVKEWLRRSTFINSREKEGNRNRE